MSFLRELKRRNVIRVGMAYLAGSWLIIQVADTVIPWLGLGDAVGRILLIVLIVGFVPAVIAAWLFEWTPDGFRFDDEVEVDAVGTVVASRRLDRVIIGILALAVVYFAADKFLFDVDRIVEAEEKLARLIAGAVKQSDLELVAQTAAWLGKKDLAFEYLERAFRGSEDDDQDIDPGVEMLKIIYRPEFSGLHSALTPSVSIRGFPTSYRTILFSSPCQRHCGSYFATVTSSNSGRGSPPLMWWAPGVSRIST